MIEKVRATIQKYNMLSKGDQVLVAVSGGPDSVAMLYVLYSLSQEYELQLYIYHLNHKLREAEADNDANFVKILGESLDIPTFLEEYTVATYVKEKRVSLQEGAREIRYALMAKKAEEIGVTKIAIGQNADDQAETILMRFLRGSGSDGLGGIMPVREGRYIRPLINITRKEIEDFLEEEGIYSRVDSSNLKSVYLRNKIRLKLLPELRKEYNPNISSVICQAGEILREESNYMEEVTKELYKQLASEVEDKIIVKLQPFKELHKALQRRIIKLLWEKISGAKEGLVYVHVEKALLFIEKAQVGSSFNLPKEIWITNSYENFSIGKIKSLNKGKNQEGQSLFSILKVPGSTELTNRKLKVVTEILPVSNEKIKNNFLTKAYFDYDLICEEVIIRTRAAGDVFRPLNGRGSKKLKEYFIDLKVPREQRDKILLFAMGNEVLWVVGYSINNLFKVSANTKNILQISLVKN